MKREIITSILFLSHLLASSSFGEEWFTRKSEKDFKYVNVFIENITEANYVVVVGDVPNISGGLCNSRFRLESEDHKKTLQSYMTNLGIREAEEPSPSHPAFHGELHYVDYTIDMVSVFDDHREYFSLSGPPLMAYLSNDQSFWIDSNSFNKDYFFEFLKLKGIKCDEIKYTGNPSQYIPPVILGSWHTEDNEVEIEFLDDGTFRFLNAPMSFCTHLSKVPNKYKIFHLIGENSKWTISDDFLSLSLIMASPLEQVTTGIEISRLDSEYLDFCCHDNSTLRFIRSKKESNQKLQPTVKTPVESGNVQGTAAEL